MMPSRGGAMIINFIIIVSIVLFAGFQLTYLVRSDYREQVERPKYTFLKNLEEFNKR